MNFIRRLLTRKIKSHDDKIKDIVKWEIIKFGNKADLNHIDTSQITDLESIFNLNPKFNGDISQWNVENVNNMYRLFFSSKFNGDISNWNVRKVVNMGSVFNESDFNGDISRWNVESVNNMRKMFFWAKFDGDISLWNVENVTNMDRMFCGIRFNGDISQWNTKNVINMYSMFFKSQFNGDLSNWNIENVKNMHSMFGKSNFNGDLDNWRPRSLDLYVNDPFYLHYLESECPIWYQCFWFGLFKSGSEYCYSLDWNWLKPGKVINRYRLEEAVENYGGVVENIDQISGYTFKN